MSTILKSLKKLEKDKEHVHGGYEQALYTPLGTPRQDMQRAVRFAWLRTKVFRLGIMAFFAILGAAGIYAYSRPAVEQKKMTNQAVNTDHRNQSQPRLGFSPERQMPNSKPAPNRAKAAASINNSLTQLEGAPGPQASRPSQPPRSLGNTDQSAVARGAMSTYAMDHFPQAQGIPVTRPPLHPGNVPGSFPADEPDYQGDLDQLREHVFPQTTYPNQGLGSQKLPDGRVPSRPTTSNTMPAVASPTEPAKSENSIYANAERMTDGRLKVQAIVWAETPNDRMAVVNSRIVREGGTIDGFSIVGIGEDAIYVREGGAGVMKVPFGGP